MASSTILIRVAGDDYKGDPLMNLYVDGVLVKSTLVSAIHRAGQWEDLKVTVPVATPSQVKVTFANDIWGGSSAQDRNLYVDHIVVNGKSFSPASAHDVSSTGKVSAGTSGLYTNGSLVFNTSSAPALPTAPAHAAGKTTITVQASADSWDGSPTMSLYLDGHKVGTATVTASHKAGKWQDITFTTSVTSAAALKIAYTNDVWGGKSTADRNLYIQSVTVDGVKLAATSATLISSNGTHHAGTAALYNDSTLSFNVSSIVKGSSSSSPPAATVTASTDSVTTAANHALKINVLGNDHSSAGYHLSLASLNSSGTHGHLVENSDGTVSYTPGSAYAHLVKGQSATDVFHYTASDGHGHSAVGTVDVKVTGTATASGSPPAATVTAGTDSASTSATTPIKINVLGNDHSSNSAYKLSVASLNTSGTHGHVVENSDGTISYTPGSAYASLAKGSTATDVFHYTVSDGHGHSAIGTVDVKVAGTATSSGSPTGGGGTPVTPGHAFYVSANGNDAWSGTLSAPNAAGTDGPKATLAGAQAAMEHSATKTTYVEAGDYYLTKSLSLTGADSGESFLAYGNGTVSIHGGQLVTGWTDGANGTVTAKIPAAEFHNDAWNNAGLGNLVVNGHEETVSRYPNAVPTDPVKGGWLYAATPLAGANPNMTIHANPGDLPHFSSTNDLYVAVTGGRGWDSYVLPVNHIDYSTNTVYLTSGGWDAMTKGARYYFFNASSELDAQHEWALNQASNTLTYKPGADFNGHNAVLANLENVVTVNGAHDVNLSGLTFTDTTKTGAAVSITNSSNVTLSGDKMLNTGDGVLISGGSNVKVTGSEINHTANHGIEVGNGASGDTLAGNYIHNIGELYMAGSGVWFTDTKNLTISHNTIDSVAKFGIGGGSIEDNHTDPSYGFVIDGNKVSNTNLDDADGGGIMIIGRQQDLMNGVISNNDVGHITAAGTVSWDGTAGSTFLDPTTKLVSFGIYLDDFASGIKVTGNVVHDSIGGIDIHSGWNNTVSNNLLVDNTGTGLAMEAPNWTGLAIRAASGNVFSHNVVDGAGNPAEQGGSLTAANFTDNVYSSTGNGFRVWGVNAPDYETFAQWQATGADHGGLVANPLVVAAANGTYALAAGSVATALGFAGLSTTSAGVTGFISHSDWDLYGTA